MRENDFFLNLVQVVCSHLQLPRAFRGVPRPHSRKALSLAKASFGVVSVLAATSAPAPLDPLSGQGPSAGEPSAAFLPEPFFGVGVLRTG